MAGCYDCKLEYGGNGWIEAIIPDKIWNKISPIKSNKQGGLLCITCISKRLKLAGFKDVPIWLCGTEPLRVIEGDPGTNLDLLRNWDQELELNK